MSRDDFLDHDPADEHSRACDAEMLACSSPWGSPRAVTTLARATATRPGPPRARRPGARPCPRPRPRPTPHRRAPSPPPPIRRRAPARRSRARAPARSRAAAIPAAAGVADSDGDGIPDDVEIALGYDPDDADSDDDSLLDGVEDPDWDGLVAPWETDVLDPDTDDDGHCDAERADNDGDGLDPDDPCDGHEVIHVDADAAAGGDGATWATAFTTLDVIVAEPGQQIWIAEGTYRATGGNAALDVPPAVDLIGGFDGTETNTAARPDSADNYRAVGRRPGRPTSPAPR